MNANGRVLELKSVVKSYGERIVATVLHGIELTVCAGEFSAIVGPSGSGKTTLLNIMGLLDRPTAGEVWIKGENTTRLDDAALTEFRGRTIGFIFQFHHLIPAFTALENVMLPLMADRGRATPEMRERAAHLLERIGLGDRLRYKPAEMSGGQQQRVAIARALVMNPAVVLADEPTGNLDSQTAREIFFLLREINREENTTFLIVTHDTRIADGCDRVISIQDGLILADNACEVLGDG